MSNTVHFFDFTTIEVTEHKFLTVEPTCNAIMVTNTGESICWVNTYPLHPADDPDKNNGETLLIGGNAGEILRTKLEIKFEDNEGNAMIIQKIYVKQ